MGQTDTDRSIAVDVVECGLNGRVFSRVPKGADSNVSQSASR